MKERGVGVAFDAFRKALGTNSIALDVQVRVVDGVFFIGSCSDLAKGARVKGLSAPER